MSSTIYFDSPSASAAGEGHVLECLNRTMIVMGAKPFTASAAKVGLGRRPPSAQAAPDMTAWP